MKVKPDIIISDLSGRRIEGNEGMGTRILAHILQTSNESKSVKLMSWARKLWDGEAIEINEMERTLLIAIVDNSPAVQALAKAPLIEYLQNIPSDKDNKS
jgi:hypothetical protein